MKPALELAIENYQRLRDEAAAALAHAQKELTSLRNTLATLEGYRNTCRNAVASRARLPARPHHCSSIRIWPPASKAP